MFNSRGRITKSTEDILRISLIFSISGFFLLVAIFSGCKFRSGENKNAGEGKEIVLRLVAGPDNPRNSEGDFITLKDGRIFFIFTRYTGESASDNASAFLAGRYSDDQGKSWSSEDIKIVEQEGTMNVMSVSLLRLENGEIALFYLRKNSETDCIPIIRISNDETMSWSNPQQCITDKNGYFCLHNNHVIQLKNGRITFAVSEESKFYTDRLWCYYSDDNGRSWESSLQVPNPDSVLTQEPAIIELKNGDIYMVIRTNAGVQYTSYSKDKGETWSPSEKSTIKSPTAPASIARIPSTGDLLLVWDDNGVNQKRTPLNIAISKDEARSWTNIKSLESDPEGRFCYTAIHFTDKNVLLGYTAGSQAKGKGWSVLNITRVSLDWIYK
jgi:sialidase-1